MYELHHVGPVEVGEDGHPRVWEVVRGVKGAPGGADKDGGGTIWVAWFHSKSLSAAETLHFFFFYEFSFAFADNLFGLQHTWRQSSRCATQLYPKSSEKLLSYCR